MVNMSKLTSIVALAVCATAAPAYTQDVGVNVELTRPPVFDQIVGQPAGPAPTPRHTGIKAMLKGLVTDVKNLPSRENLFWVGVGSGLSLAVHPADDSVNQHLVGSGFANSVFTPAEIMADLPTFLAPPGTIYPIVPFTHH